MRKIIAFDVDGTLRDYEDCMRHEIVDLMRWFIDNTDWTIVVWSGGGRDRAAQMYRQVGIKAPGRIQVMAKNDALKPDITIDDQDIMLGKVNIKAPPPSGELLEEVDATAVEYSKP